MTDTRPDPVTTPGACMCVDGIGKDGLVVLHHHVPALVNKEESEDQFRDATNMIPLERAIVGALRDTIHTHGPITAQWVSSAAKRIAGNLRNCLVNKGEPVKIIRADVYAAIDSERAYQDRKWGRTASSGKPGHGDRSIDEFALYISVYSDQLRAIAGTSEDSAQKLHAVRKIAALAVACMEQHGAPKRGNP